MTALTIASYNNHSAIVEILIAKGADINITNSVLYILYSIVTRLTMYMMIGWMDSIDVCHI